MPNNPPKQVAPYDAVLGRIEARSELLAESATRLSEAIEQIDARLKAMPGKVTASVESPDGRLFFARRPDWGLWLIDDAFDGDPDCGGDDLTKVSVSRKARAFPLALELLVEIDREQQRLLGEIVTVHELLPVILPDMEAK